MNKKFQVYETKDRCVQWIRNWFAQNGSGCNAVIGISGGKDSSIVAALCVEALGKERVIGVLMPCGEQADIDMAKKLIEHLDIRSYEVNIKKAVDGILGEMTDVNITEQTRINLLPRVRMTTLYAMS